MTKPDTRRLRAVLADVDRPEGVTYGDEARFEEAFDYGTIAALLDAADNDWSPLLAAIRAVLESDSAPDA